MTRAIIWSSISQLLGAALMFAVGIMTARILGPENRGLYATFFFSAGLASTVFRMGIHESIVFFHNKAGEDIDKALGNALVYLIFAVIFGGLATVVLAALPMNHTYIYSASYLIIASLVISSTEIFGGLIVATHRYNLYLTNTLIQNSLVAVSTIALAISKSPDLEKAISWRIISLVFALIIPTLYAFGIYRRLGMSFSPRLLGKQLWFGIKTTIQLLIGLLNFRVYLFFCLALIGSAATGAFSVCLLFVEPIRFVPAALGIILFPVLTKQTDEARSDRLMASVSRRVTFLSIAGALLGIALAPVVTPRLFGMEYSNTILPSQIMIAAGVLGVSFQIFSRYFTSRHMQRYNIACACIGLCVAIVSSLALMPTFGLKGAALAFLTGYGSSGCLLIGVFLRKSGLSLADVLVIRQEDFQEMWAAFRHSLVRQP